MTLDDTLAAWAASVRLPPAVTDRIYERIVTARPPLPVISPGLEPGWWRQFNAGYTARMVAAARRAA